MASEARRLACRAEIIPIVLGGGPAVVLDAGRNAASSPRPNASSWASTTQMHLAGCDEPADQ